MIFMMIFVMFFFQLNWSPDVTLYKTGKILLNLLSNNHVSPPQDQEETGGWHQRDGDRSWPRQQGPRRGQEGNQEDCQPGERDNDYGRVWALPTCKKVKNIMYFLTKIIYDAQSPAFKFRLVFFAFASDTPFLGRLWTDLAFWTFDLGSGQTCIKFQPNWSTDGRDDAIFKGKKTQT